jgi:hypothetical protein
MSRPESEDLTATATPDCMHTSLRQPQAPHLCIPGSDLGRGRSGFDPSSSWPCRQLWRGLERCFRTAQIQTYWTFPPQIEIAHRRRLGLADDVAIHDASRLHGQYAWLTKAALQFGVREQVRVRSIQLLARLGQVAPDLAHRLDGLTLCKRGEGDRRGGQYWGGDPEVDPRVAFLVPIRDRLLRSAVFFG